MVNEVTTPRSGAAPPDVDEAAVATTRFDDLSPRERECLRLVFEFKTSKDIVRELGIAKSTIDGYLAEAVRKLGARDRKHAALLLAAREGRAATIPQAVAASAPPQVASGPDPAGVVRSALSEAPGAAQGWPGDWRSVLPLRRRDARHNPLSPGQRLLWIVLLALAMMIGFGMLTTGLAALTDVVVAAARLLWR